MANPEQIVEERGPYTVTSREILHDKYSMQLIHDGVIRPDGTSGDQYWINFTRRAVLVFILDRDHNLYMQEEFCYGLGRWLLEVPGGSPEENEPGEVAAARKAQNEIGVSVRLDSIDYLGEVAAITSRVNNPTQLFVARVESIGEPREDNRALISRKRVPLAEAVQMSLNGEIVTATVAIGILRLDAFLKSRESAIAQSAPQLNNRQIAAGLLVTAGVLTTSFLLGRQTKR